LPWQCQRSSQNVGNFQKHDLSALEFKIKNASKSRTVPPLKTTQELGGFFWHTALEQLSQFRHSTASTTHNPVAKRID